MSVTVIIGKMSQNQRQRNKILRLSSKYIYI